MKLIFGVLVAAALAACGGKSNPPVTANEAETSSTAAPAPTDGECVPTCIADGGPKDANGNAIVAPEEGDYAIERQCKEQCGELDPGPEAMEGYEP